MIVFNLCAEPGGGKSTAAADLYVTFKRAGIEAELVGETAREYIYGQGKAPLFDNQFLIGGQQWERLLRLHRCGVPVAVSDSPIMQGMLYAEHLPYYNELKALLWKCNQFFPNTYNIFIKRAWPYQGANRNQTEAEAAAMTVKAKELVGPIWKEVFGDEAGMASLRTDCLQLVQTLLAK